MLTAGLLTSLGGAPGNAAGKFASLGTQICKHQTGFVYMVLDHGGKPNAFCYDDSVATGTQVPLGHFRNNGFVVALDNETGHRIFLAGMGPSGDSHYNYCFERGLDWALGGPSDGGHVQQHLNLDTMNIGKTGDCPPGNPKNDGTTDPGSPPSASPGCKNANRLPNQGAHVFLFLSDEIPATDPLDSFTRFGCLSSSPGSHTFSSLHGQPFGVINGTPHTVLVSGVGMATACVSSDHAITPVSAGAEKNADKITVQSGSNGTCP
jgi:hypothetical protein